MGAVKKLSSESLKVLGGLEIGTMDGGAGLAKITTGQLDRKIYLEVNEALETAGGIWSRKHKGHVFGSPVDFEDKLGAILSAGEVVDPKKLFQFYETPDVLADELIARAQIKKGMSVLEPSAGRGSLLHALQRAAIWDLTITAVELDRSHEKHLLDLTSDNKLFMGHDFEAFALMCQERFDRIVMNPPFAKQQDAKHITAAFMLLKPGGRLAAIASAAVRFRETESYRFVRDNAVEIIDNPEGSFSASGTDVHTCIVIMEKK